MIDVLHLLLRIGDRLFLKLIQVRCTSKELQTALTRALAELSVKFDFWTNKGGELQWTKLNGVNNTLALSQLDLVALLGEDAGQPIEQLWRDFMAIYRRINAQAVPDLAKLQADIEAWTAQYLQQYSLILDDDDNMVGVEEGMYGNNDITPYIHMLMAHVVEQIKRHGSLRKYSCQTLEHVNHINQLVFFRMTPRGMCAGSRVRVVHECV